MEYRCDTLKILGFIVLLTCAPFSFASDAPPPVATLDVSELLANVQRESLPTTVAFLSDSSIGVGVCPSAGYAKCSLSIVRWENGSFRLVAESTQVDPGSSRQQSANGSRMLFDFNSRTVPMMQHLRESVGTIITLGMSGPEDVNREVVRVIDTATRKSCFEWHRSFPMTYSRARSAAISPSGEFVAIIVGANLSIYRLPTVCEGPKIATVPIDFGR
jgi:hypothetical protein